MPSAGPVIFAAAAGSSTVVAPPLAGLLESLPQQTAMH